MPCIIVGRITVLKAFPFSFLDIRLSHSMTSDTFLHRHHLACTLYLTSLPQSPRILTFDPREGIYFHLRSSPPHFVEENYMCLCSPFRLDPRSLSYSHLTLIPLLSSAFHHIFQLSSTCSFDSLHTTSSTNIIHHADADVLYVHYYNTTSNCLETRRVPMNTVKRD